MYYCEQWLEWWLIIMVFDFVAVDRIIIITSKAGIFAKTAEASYAAPVISKD